MAHLQFKLYATANELQQQLQQENKIKVQRNILLLLWYCCCFLSTTFKFSFMEKRFHELFAGITRKGRS